MSLDHSKKKFKPTGFVNTVTLSLNAADAIANMAIKNAKEGSFKPISVAVLDSHGNTIVSKRMDGVPVSEQYNIIKNLLSNYFTII